MVMKQGEGGGYLAKSPKFYRLDYLANTQTTYGLQATHREGLLLE